MPKLADSTAETTTTTGTGTLTLAGAKTGFRAFSAGFTNGDEVYYSLRGGAEWESGIGIYNSGTLTRATILASSNAGAAVSLSAGSKDVFCSASTDALVALGPYASTGALATAKPPANYTGRIALVGASAPYSPYISDGTTWAALIAGASGDPYVAIGSSGAAQSISIASAGMVDLTLTANCTLTITGATSGAAFSLRLVLRQDSVGSRTVTWPANTKWSLGVAPLLSTGINAIDEVVLTTYDGGTSFFGDLVAKGRA